MINRFQYQFQGWGRFPTPTSNSWMPVGCPTIQLNSDTVYLETASDSTGEGLRPPRLSPPSDASRKPGLLPVLLTDCLHISFVSEGLIELREKFYLLDQWFIIKGYKLGTARWKRGTGQGMGRGQGTSTPSSAMPLSPNLHVFTNPEALQTLSFWGFMVASLQRHD